MNLKTIYYFYIFMALTTLNSCQKNEYIHLQGQAQGTTFSIKYHTPRGTNYQSEIENIFRDIDLSLSNYKPNSIISKINNGDSTQILDQHFLMVFKLSQHIHQETNGYFDPSVGLLVNAFGFGASNPPDSLKQYTTQDLKHFVGLKHIKVKNNKLIKKHQQTYLDFNSIAQGYTVDVIKDFLKKHHIKDFMIEVGGEIYAQGLNPKKEPWHIGIQNPNDDDISSQKTITLNHQAIATSGNYRKYKIAENGKKYVHTINPISGTNEPSNLLSATVITKNSCAQADAIATALMAMGFEKSKIFLTNHNSLHAYLIYSDEDGFINTFEK